MKKFKKDGTLSKYFLRQDIEQLDFYNTCDVGKGSRGIIKINLFSGGFGYSKSRHKYLGSEYYFIEIVNDNYKDGLHRFTCKVLQVIKGQNKKVNDTFVKRGKNLYGNYHEMICANSEILKSKHERGMISKSMRIKRY